MSLTITEHDLTTTTTLRLTSQYDFKLEGFDRSTATVNQLVKSMIYNGGVVVKNFLTPDEVARAEEAAKPVLDSMTYANPADTTKRISRLPTRLPDLVERVLTDDLYMGVADHFLSVKHESWLGNKFCQTVAKSIACATTMFAVAPNTAMQDLHRDDSIYFNTAPRITPEEYTVGRDRCISFFIAGRKTTKENGATVFSPGSHLDAYNDPPARETCIAAELEAGDAFIMLSSCYHGAGENSTTDQERLVYSLFMMQPHLRQVSANLLLAWGLGVVIR